MLRLSKVQNLKFEKTREDRFLVSWEGALRRYHVWYYPKGDGLNDTLHSNPLVAIPGRHSRGGHKPLDLMSARWAPMREDLLAYLTGARFAEAEKAYEVKEAAKVEEQQEERYGAAIGRVNAVLDRKDITLDGKSRNVFNALLTIPRDDLLRLL